MKFYTTELFIVDSATVGILQLLHFYFESRVYLDLSLIGPLCLTNHFVKDKDKHKVRFEGGKLALNRCVDIFL